LSRLSAATASVAIFCLGFAAGGDGGDSKRRLNEVEKRIHRAQEEKQSIDAETESVLGAIDELDRSVDAHQRRLKEISADMRAAQSRKLEAERLVGELDRALVRLKERFTARARGLYRLTRRGLAPVVFQAPRDLSDALRYRRGLEAILAQDRELAAEIGRNRAAVEVAREEAKGAANTLSQRRTENERELTALKSERSAKQTMLASLRGEGVKRSRLLEELRSSAEKLRSLLQREEEAAKASPFQRPAGAASGMVPPLAATGKEIVTARNGVEIRAEAGASIRAVTAGRVVFADWFTGYGKMVILDHGDRLYSIYGYASDLLVEAGRVVTAGESIATVGATGPASAPSLYFEIRDHGVPRDPGAYIAILARK
jgi:murein hydrolase activator